MDFISILTSFSALLFLTLRLIYVINYSKIQCSWSSIGLIEIVEILYVLSPDLYHQNCIISVTYQTINSKKIY